MDKDKKADIDAQIADAIAGRPIPFKAGERWFYLYPTTLGRQQLSARLIAALDINVEALQRNLFFEALRLASTKRDVCIELITLYTSKTKAEVFDQPTNIQKRKFFEEYLDSEDIATLLVSILSADQTELFAKHLGIDKESNRLSQVARIKNKDDKSTLSFGGISVFGTLLDAACERYGWTYDYCTWGVPLPVLRLMLADKVQSIFLTDKERKKIPAYLRQRNEDGIVIRADDPKNKEAIRAMNWH